MDNENDFESGYDFDPPESVQERLEDLSERIEQLEATAQESASDRRHGIGLAYALGMAIAVTLSWARNASLSWCILHGFLSWVYVIYFAATR
ncbi:MAG TPA: hypothetical protein VFC39_22305 [Acidobacteriaceae bacterium]|nr:hypothetical protein [Acidobacteriaceae bacterium]